MVIATAISSCILATRPPTGEVATQPDLDAPAELWVLIHPSDAPMGAGIFRVDLEAQTILEHLPLPDPVESPHALHDDGEVLWLGSLGDDRIYALDRSDGTVLDAWEGRYTEGIVGADGRLFTNQGGEIQEVDADLNLLQSHAGLGVIQDVALVGEDLYILQNGGEDTLRRLDVQTGEVTAVAPRRELELHAPYAMEAWHGRLLIGDWLDQWQGINILEHYDLQTGSMVGHTLLPVDGWVTAVSVPAEL